MEKYITVKQKPVDLNKPYIALLPIKIPFMRNRREGIITTFIKSNDINRIFEIINEVDECDEIWEFENTMLDDVYIYENCNKLRVYITNDVKKVFKSRLINNELLFESSNGLKIRNQYTNEYNVDYINNYNHFENNVSCDYEFVNVYDYCYCGFERFNVKYETYTKITQSIPDLGVVKSFEYFD